MESSKIIATLSDDKVRSQTDLANYSGVSRAMIGKYERGEAVPYIDAAKRIADAFDVSFNFLLGEGQNAKFNNNTVKQLHDIEYLNPTIKDKLFFLIYTVIRDTNDQKAYI